MLYTWQYRTECAAKKPGDQSGPRSKRVDLMQTSSWSSSSHASRSVRQPRQQTLTQQNHTPAGEAHSGRKPPVGRMCVRARRQGPTTEAATTETSHASRSSSSSSHRFSIFILRNGYVGRYPWQCGQRLSISASWYCDTLSRQQRSRSYFLCSRDDDVM